MRCHAWCNAVYVGFAIKTRHFDETSQEIFFSRDFREKPSQPVIPVIPEAIS